MIAKTHQTRSAFAQEPEFDPKQLPNILYQWYVDAEYVGPAQPVIEEITRELGKWVRERRGPVLPLIKKAHNLYSGRSQFLLTIAENLPAEALDEELLYFCAPLNTFMDALVRRQGEEGDRIRQRIEKQAAAWVGFEDDRALKAYAMFETLLPHQSWRLSDASFFALIEALRSGKKPVRNKEDYHRKMQYEILSAVADAPSAFFEALYPTNPNDGHGIHALASHPATPIHLLRRLATENEEIFLNCRLTLVGRDDALRDPVIRRALLETRVLGNSYWQKCRRPDDVAICVRVCLRRGDIQSAQEIMTRYLDEESAIHLKEEDIMPFFRTDNPKVREWATTWLASRLRPKQQEKTARQNISR